jgi:hypothetical protein
VEDICVCEAQCKILNIWKRKSFDAHVGPEKQKGAAEIGAWLYPFSWRVHRNFGGEISRGYITVLKFFRQPETIIFSCKAIFSAKYVFEALNSYKYTVCSRFCYLEPAFDCSP